MSTLKVVPLPNQKNEDDGICRKILTSTAERESGIAGIGVVVLRRDGTVSTEFYTGNDVFAFLGATEMLSHRVKTERFEEREE